MIWPENKKFAFTIIDETDYAFTEKIIPIYDFLYLLNIKTTKTVWVYKSSDSSYGDSLENEAYRQFILDIYRKGYEIALHNICHDGLETSRMAEGLKKFNMLFGTYPLIQTNHSNKNNIYWGYKRFEFPLKQIYKLLSKRTFEGEELSSNFFWGKEVKDKIKYIRNLSYKSCNILNIDPQMPYYHYNKKKFSNYWFSTTCIKNVDEFVKLMSFDNILKLEKEGGLCMINTCMGTNRFVNNEGKVDERIEKIFRFLIERDGYFAPASDILNYLSKQNENNTQPGYFYHIKLNLKWLLHNIKKN